MTDQSSLSRATQQLALDGFASFLSISLSVTLIYGRDIVEQSPVNLLVWTVSFTLISLVMLTLFKTHRRIWRYTNFSDLLTVAKAVGAAHLAFMVVIFLWNRMELFPRSALLANLFVMMVVLAGPRVLYVCVKASALRNGSSDAVPRKPVLMAGTGDDVDFLLKQIERSPHLPYRVIGFLDWTGRRAGRFIHSIPVLGSVHDLPAIMARLRKGEEIPDRIILTPSFKKPSRLQKLQSVAEELGLGLIDGDHPYTGDNGRDGLALRLQSMDVANLLERRQRIFDRDSMAHLVLGRRILITGAGGTIGAQLARRIAELGPARLVLLDNSEFNLYQISLELSESATGVPRRSILGDIRNEPFINRVFEEEAPELVFHAAALKHVPIAEDNPCEAATINVIGTRIVADAARRHGVEKMVLISTDKAINPSSFMGATKRFAEAYCQAIDKLPPDSNGTRFLTVRFGNVIGSTGSVVELFRRQILNGGPVTVTDPAMRRYFLTIGEAIDLTLTACTLEDREPHARGSIRFLDMGEPIAIMDLAKRMIRLSGLVPDKDINIIFSGPRAGEKLHEELVHSSEALSPTSIDGIFVVEPRTVDLQFLIRMMADLDQAAGQENADRVRAIVRQMVPEYTFSGTQAPILPADAATQAAR